MVVRDLPESDNSVLAAMCPYSHCLGTKRGKNNANKARGGFAGFY